VIGAHIQRDLARRHEPVELMVFRIATGADLRASSQINSRDRRFGKRIVWSLAGGPSPNDGASSQRPALRPGA